MIWFNVNFFSNLLSKSLDAWTSISFRFFLVYKIDMLFFSANITILEKCEVKFSNVVYPSVHECSWKDSLLGCHANPTKHIMLLICSSFPMELIILISAVHSIPTRSGTRVLHLLLIWLHLRLQVLLDCPFPRRNICESPAGPSQWNYPWFMQGGWYLDPLRDPLHHFKGDSFTWCLPGWEPNEKETWKGQWILVKSN